jgi:hypothetical protein
MRELALLLALAAITGCPRRDGDLCTHSRRCEGGYVCVFGDSATEVDNEEDEVGTCMSRQQVDELRKL